MLGKLLKKRKAAKFKTLAYPHLGLLYNLALRYTGHRFDAEDLVQETMFRAFRKLDQLRDEAHIKAWLVTILRHTYLEESRRQSKVQLVTDENSYTHLLEGVAKDNIALDFEHRLGRQTIKAILKTLPEKYKTPLLLHYMEEMSYREISEVLNIPPGTVMSRLARGKQHMKEKMMAQLNQIKDREPIMQVERFSRLAQNK